MSLLFLLLASNVASYGCWTTVLTTVIGINPKKNQKSQIAIQCLA